MSTQTAPYLADGPLDALLRALGVVRDDHRDVLRESTLFALVGWLPLMLLAAIGRAWHAPPEPLLHDYGVHARLLVAIPLFVAAQRALATRTREVVTRLAGDGFLDDRRALARIARGADAWSRSPVLELGLLAIALLCSEAMGTGILRASGLFGGEPLTASRGPATLWYLWAAFPLFAFLALRFLVRWLAWTVSAWRVARLPLATEPMHPDRAGGLAFVALPTVAAALFVLGMSAIAAASWASRGGHMVELGTSAAIWVALSLVLSLAPLVGFAGGLMRTRRRGLRDYDQLALSYTRQFHRRWIDRMPGPELLGTPDVQSLNDLQSACHVVRELRPLPIEPRQLVLIIVAALVPFVPAVLTEVPLSELLSKAMHTVLGIGR